MHIHLTAMHTHIVLLEAIDPIGTTTQGDDSQEGTSCLSLLDYLLHDIRQVLDALLAISTSAYSTLSLFPWIALSAAVLSLFRLSFQTFPFCPAWTLDYVRSRLDLATVMLTFVSRFEEAREELLQSGNNIEKARMEFLDGCITKATWMGALFTDRVREQATSVSPSTSEADGVIWPSTIPIVTSSTVQTSDSLQHSKVGSQNELQIHSHTAAPTGDMATSDLISPASIAYDPVLFDGLEFQAYREATLADIEWQGGWI